MKNKTLNVAFGERTSLNQLAQILKDNLSTYDPAISNVIFEYGETRADDVPHSLASIEKGKTILGYSPEFSVERGLMEVFIWYWKNIK